MSNNAPARSAARVEATRIPSHGHGRLAPPFGPDNPGNPNPGARPAVLKDVQKLARKKSVDALHALVACYTTPDGKIARNVDGRIVVHAASKVLEWAFGTPPQYDPAQDKPETTIDLSGLSLAERRRLLETMERVSVIADPNAIVDDGPDFDPARFAPEPVEIEGAVVVDEPPAIMARPIPKAKAAPKAKGKPGRPPKDWREKAGKAATQALAEEEGAATAHPRLNLF